MWQREFDGCIVELLDMRATAFVIGHFLHSDDLENWKDLELIGVQMGSYYAYHNKPEWHEREHDDEHPYRDSTG